MTAPDAPPDSFRHTQATHATPPRLPGTDGISILIATHNRSATLDRALQSLSLARMVPGVPVEAVVVANACSDDSARARPPVEHRPSEIQRG